MPFLLIDSQPDKEWFSVVYFELSAHDKERIKRGWIKCVEINEADAKLPLDVLSRLYDSKKTTNTKSSRQIDLNVIVGIIKTSDQAGERDAARLVYKKLTGKAFVG